MAQGQKMTLRAMDFVLNEQWKCIKFLAHFFSALHKNWIKSIIIFLIQRIPCPCCGKPLHTFHISSIADIWRVNWWSHHSNATKWLHCTCNNSQEIHQSQRTTTQNIVTYYEGRDPNLQLIQRIVRKNDIISPDRSIAGPTRQKLNGKISWENCTYPRFNWNIWSNRTIYYIITN